MITLFIHWHVMTTTLAATGILFLPIYQWEEDFVCT